MNETGPENKRRAWAEALSIDARESPVSCGAEPAEFWNGQSAGRMLYQRNQLEKDHKTLGRIPKLYVTAQQTVLPWAVQSWLAGWLNGCSAGPGAADWPGAQSPRAAVEAGFYSNPVSPDASNCRSPTKTQTQTKPRKSLSGPLRRNLSGEYVEIASTFRKPQTLKLLQNCDGGKFTLLLCLRRWRWETVAQARQTDRQGDVRRYNRNSTQSPLLMKPVCVDAGLLWQGDAATSTQHQPLLSPGLTRHWQRPASRPSKGKAPGPHLPVIAYRSTSSLVSMLPSAHPTEAL